MAGIAMLAFRAAAHFTGIVPKISVPDIFKPQVSELAPATSTPPQERPKPPGV
jgi:hypothetical protein